MIRQANAGKPVALNRGVHAARHEIIIMIDGVDVVGHRLRRLLMPLWALGIVLVPLMLWQGWATATDDNTLYWANLLY